MRSALSQILSTKPHTHNFFSNSNSTQKPKSTKFNMTHFGIYPRTSVTYFNNHKVTILYNTSEMMRIDHFRAV